jgi:hypothetical protein
MELGLSSRRDYSWFLTEPLTGHSGAAIFISVNARWETGLFFKPAGEIVLIQKAKGLADFFDQALFFEETEDFAEK